MVTEHDESIPEMARIIAQCERLVVLTGAGMSRDSGVPDFRSPEGWWRQINPAQVATVEAFNERYSLFHEFYSYRIKQLENVRPHEGHRVLSKWEREGKLVLIATQNVDRLHQLAGNQKVCELHGTILEYHCARCHQPAEREAFLQKQACSCGGRLRPNVVLFGERLPEEAWEKALSAIESADAVLVIGTSLQVAPVKQLPFLTRGKLLLINRDLTGEEARFDCVVQGGARDCLQAIDRLLTKKGGSS